MPRTGNQPDTAYSSGYRWKCVLFSIFAYLILSDVEDRAKVPAAEPRGIPFAQRRRRSAVAMHGVAVLLRFLVGSGDLKLVPKSALFSGLWRSKTDAKISAAALH